MYSYCKKWHSSVYGWCSSPWIIDYFIYLITHPNAVYFSFIPPLKANRSVKRWMTVKYLEKKEKINYSKEKNRSQLCKSGVGILMCKHWMIFSEQKFMIFNVNRKKPLSVRFVLGILCKICIWMMCKNRD